MQLQDTGDRVPRWPEITFTDSFLSQPLRQQLSKLIRDTQAGFGTKRRSHLLGLLHRYAYHIETGTYVPVGDRVSIPGKLPIQSCQFARQALAYPTTALDVAYFSNPLVIPEGFGDPDFDVKAAAPPHRRLTSTGFLIATVEFDPETANQFEEIFSWTRGKHGKFANSKFAEVDRKLCRLRDYRGFSIVYSGRVSLHFHFLFSTAHIRSIPHDAAANERRQSSEAVAALMHNVHDLYWDHASAVMIDTLRPSIAADEKMRSPTQWRRTGGGVRVIDKACSYLGLEVGDRVPQLIIAENIRERAPKSAETFLVSRDIRLSSPPPRRRKASSAALPYGGVSADVIGIIQDRCSCEWGDYPMPVAVGQQNEGSVIRFKNHRQDQNPSTVCVGQNRKLLLAGQHSFQQDFYLPDNMTADAPP